VQIEDGLHVGPGRLAVVSRPDDRHAPAGFGDSNEALDHLDPLTLD
jgi:hypothetical protein